MATSAMARNLGGLAIDGCVRDSAEMIALGFPVFCRGFCMRGTTKAVLGLINYPTLFGGVLINPGDLILGDDDGIVVVERDSCDAILEKSLQRIQTEITKSEQLKQGTSSVQINKLDQVFKSLGLVEQ